MYETFIYPYMKELIDSIKSEGVKIIMLDSDDNISKLIDWYIRCGVNVLLPFEVQAGMDIVEVRKKYTDLGIIGGIDKKHWQHSCGAIESIIGDFIELGADILNPVQVSASGMNPEILKKKYGKDITFCGGIDTQGVLPFGTADEVRVEVRRISEILGEGGGYILAGSQALEDDIPEENIVAMYDEGRKI